MLASAPLLCLRVLVSVSVAAVPGPGAEFSSALSPVLFYTGGPVPGSLSVPSAAIV